MFGRPQSEIRWFVGSAAAVGLRGRVLHWVAVGNEVSSWNEEIPLPAEVKPADVVAIFPSPATVSLVTVDGRLVVRDLQAKRWLPAVNAIADEVAS